MNTKIDYIGLIIPLDKRSPYVTIHRVNKTTTLCANVSYDRAGQIATLADRILQRTHPIITDDFVALDWIPTRPTG